MALCLKRLETWTKFSTVPSLLCNVMLRLPFGSCVVLVQGTPPGLNDRNPESNMSAWTCVNTRNRDLGSGLKHIRDSTRIKRAKHKLSPVLFLPTCFT